MGWAYAQVRTKQAAAERSKKRVEQAEAFISQEKT